MARGTGITKFILAALTVFSAGIIFLSCEVDKEIKPKEPEYAPTQIFPPGWPMPFYQFENNPLSKEKFALGRKLFYDPILSVDNTISCGTCHQQFAAFANAGHTVSHGINGLFGNRNSPAIQNINWNTSFMWDGGINHIEVQPLGPITNPVEMAEDINNVVAKLQANQEYRTLFTNAYGNDSVTTQRIFKAMAQFMGMMYSYNSRYDRHLRGESGGEFSAAEMNGYNLFKQHCTSCHTEPLLTDNSFRNNGLAPDPALADSGRAHITGDPNDLYKFKVPSLRNIALTAPYMHDGRFSSLYQVMNHYHTGVQNTGTLDPLLTNGINLTTQEKTDVISFLQTLSDYNFIYDPKFSDPN